MEPKIVLISGCSSGMGLATAVLLAKDPEKRFKVYATMRNLAKKAQLEEEGKEHVGDTLIIEQMDVCCDESVNKTVQDVIDKEGRIDVLFNNAGTSLFAVLECVPIQQSKNMFETNFFGALRLINAVLPGMKAKESGVIINNSSHGGVIGYPFADVYCASKFALEGLTESMAPLLRQFNIRCAILEPGPVKTHLLTNAAAPDISSADDKTKQLFARNMERYGTLSVGTEITGERIAEIVRDIILCEKPNLRYQTNEKFHPDEIAVKLTDPTGNKPIDLVSKRYLEDESEPLKGCKLKKMCASGGKK